MRGLSTVRHGERFQGRDLADDMPVGAAAVHDVVSVAPSATLTHALELIIQEHVEHLPVIDDHRLVGICTRTDIIKARRTQWSQEQTEPGWRPNRMRWRSRPRNAE